MGNLTDYIIRREKGPAKEFLRLKQDLKALGHPYDYETSEEGADELILYQTDWYVCEEDCIEASLKHPKLTFSVTSQGEDPIGHYIEYYRNGRMAAFALGGPFTPQLKDAETMMDLKDGNAKSSEKLKLELAMRLRDAWLSCLETGMTVKEQKGPDGRKEILAVINPGTDEELIYDLKKGTEKKKQ